MSLQMLTDFNSMDHFETGSIIAICKNSTLTMIKMPFNGINTKKKKNHISSTTVNYIYNTDSTKM